MIRPRRLVAAVAALVLLAGACGGDDDEAAPTPDASATATESSAPEASLADEVSEIATDFVGDRNGGVAVLVTREGETVTTAVGVADVSGAAIESDDAFRVGSISKPFVATMVLQLVDEGVVALDDPLGDHLPGTVGADATIDQLLGHRSGIPNYTAQPSFFADALADRGARLTVDDVLAYVDGVDGGPVETFAYSNTNYILLGALIEQVDGGDLAASLATRITDPLGMDATYFETADRPSAGVSGWSEGVIAGERDAVYTSIATGAWAAGSLVSTTSDLATFLDALLGGELVSAASLAAMTDTGPTGYGLGVLQASFGPGSVAYGHSGGIPGYTSTMALDPQSGEMLVILTNNDRLIADLLAQRLLR